MKEAGHEPGLFYCSIYDYGVQDDPEAGTQLNSSIEMKSVESYRILETKGLSTGFAGGGVSTWTAGLI